MLLFTAGWWILVQRDLGPLEVDGRRSSPVEPDRASCPSAPATRRGNGRLL